MPGKETKSKQDAFLTEITQRPGTGMADLRPIIRNGWSKYNHIFILTVVLVFGSCLRIWNMDYGIPNMYRIGSTPVPALHPDEHYLVQEMKDILDNPLYYKEFKYPPLHPQIGALAAWLSGHRDEISLYLIGRWISILSSILTILVVWRIGLIWGRSIGAWAAALFAFCMVAAREAHWANPEPLAAFFLGLSFLLFYTGRRKASAFFAGICLGLSVCAKYFGVLFIPLALTPLVLSWADRAAFRRNVQRFWLFSGGLVICVAVGLGFFVFRNPQGLVQSVGVGGMWAAGTGSWGAFPPPVSPPHYFSWILPAAMGLPAYGCAVGGMLFLLIKFRSSGGIILAFLPFLVFLELLHYRAIRFTCSAVPFLCLAAAFLIDWAAKDAFHSRVMRLVIRTVATGVACFSFLYCFAYIRCLDKTRDPRLHLERIAQDVRGRCLLLGVNHQTGTLDIVKYDHSAAMVGTRDELRKGDLLFVPETFRLLLSQWYGLERQGYRYSKQDWYPMDPPGREMLGFIEQLEHGERFVLEERIWNRPTVFNVPLDWFHLPFDFLFISNFRVDVYRYNPP